MARKRRKGNLLVIDNIFFSDIIYGKKPQGGRRMYRKCATEISARHQHQVTESLLELMQKMPFEDITVTQLCQTAGITRRIFYHLFSNKTGALHALVDRKILDIESYGRDIPNDSLRFLLYWKNQQPFLDVLAENGMSGLLLERMINNVLAEDYDVIYWLQRNGWDKNSKDIIIFGLSGLMGLLYSWHFSGFQQEPDQMAALVEQILRPYSR